MELSTREEDVCRSHGDWDAANAGRTQLAVQYGTENGQREQLCILRLHGHSRQLVRRQLQG